MDEKKLIITFKNTLGNNFYITIDNPGEDIKKQDIIDAMNIIKNKNTFQPKVCDIAQCVSAKVVDSTTIEYDLNV